MNLAQNPQILRTKSFFLILMVTALWSSRLRNNEVLRQSLRSVTSVCVIVERQGWRNWSREVLEKNRMKSKDEEKFAAKSGIWAI